MFKLNQLITSCVAATMICFSVNTVFYFKISEKFNEVQQKQVENDGRRNAQYGIIKSKLEQCGGDHG